jgi:hypothetical protein
MGDAAWHLDLFEQPGRKSVFQHPVKVSTFEVQSLECKGAGLRFLPTAAP